MIGAPQNRINKGKIRPFQGNDGLFPLSFRVAPALFRLILVGIFFCFGAAVPLKAAVACGAHHLSPTKPSLLTMAAAMAIAPGSAKTQSSNPLQDLIQLQRSLYAWRRAQAQAIAQTLPDDGPSLYGQALVDFYSARYRNAQARFTQALNSGELSQAMVKRSQELLALCDGEIEVFGDAKVHTSPSGRFEAVLANPKDEVILPYLFDAMDRAYDTLGQALGVRPTAPVRFEIINSPADLAKITDLPLDAVYTTGTVGITKFHRIMMASPRVMMMGYGWLDTAVHEYVHYLISIRTQNKTPVWLHEGLAKHYESRWRDPKGEPLNPRIASLLHKALVGNDLVTLEQMHPSIALLPSQKKAAQAYAQVQTMIGFLEQAKGASTIGFMLDQIRRGVDAKKALTTAYGQTFAKFEANWKKYTTRLTAAHSGATYKDRQFRSSSDDDPELDPTLLGEVFSQLRGGKARQHARLGVLLQLQGHERAALIEYQKVLRHEKKAAQDPLLARRLGELYLRYGQSAKALPLLNTAAKHEPENANLATAQLEAALDLKKYRLAEDAAFRAIAQNPMIPRLHCALAELAKIKGQSDRLAHERRFCGGQDPDSSGDNFSKQSQKPGRIK